MAKSDGILAIGGRNRWWPVPRRAFEYPDGERAVPMMVTGASEVGDSSEVVGEEP